MEKIDIESELQDDTIVKRERNKTLDIILERDIWAIIEKMKLQSFFTKEAAKEIFQELDTEKIGKIKTADFIDYLQKSHPQSNFAFFYSLLSNELVSKSEKIILKLKRLKEKAFLSKENDSLDDIDWMIATITESDLNEPEISYVINKTSDFEKFGLDYLAQYSQMWHESRKVNDLVKAQKVNHNTTSFLKLNSNINQYHRQSIDLSEYISNSETSSEISLEDERRNSEIYSPFIISKLANSLENIDNFDFNIFDLNEILETKTLLYMSREIFSRYNYFDSIVKESKFKSFIRKITEGYDRKVSYHNDLHAADVLQTTFVMLTKGNLISALQLKEIDIFAILLSAICHDFKHPGQNNLFLINDRSPLAITYNDSSVLENYHISETFKIINQAENNIFESLTPEEYRIVRRRMIESVIATDMGAHAKNLTSLRNKLETFDIKNGKYLERMIFPGNVSKTYENQQCILNMVIHSADISNPAKPANINKIWVDLIFIEFFKQGDLEKSKDLQVSLLCDRNNTNVNKSQIGFISFIVQPTFEALYNVIPEIAPYLNTIKANAKRYEDIAKQEDYK